MRSILDIIWKMDLDVLRLKAKPSCDPKTRKCDELFVYEVKYPRRPELVNNKYISGISNNNKEDSLIAYSGKYAMANILVWS